MRLFVSYTRRDGAVVRSLAEHLEQAGHQVWLDREHHGGEAWWATVLAEIRTCDVFVVALSQQTLSSKVCQAEAAYARSLGLPMLPVQIGEVETYQANPIAAVKFIDYRNPTAETAIALISALHASTARQIALPDPLPEAPPLPFAYALRLHQTISDDTPISHSDQAAIVTQLRQALRDESDEPISDDIRSLLRDLRNRPDATYATVAEIDQTLSSDQPISAPSTYGSHRAVFPNAQRQSTPAGWYPEPAGEQGRMRYWDGSRWTEHVGGGVASPSTSTSTSARMRPRSAPRKPRWWRRSRQRAADASAPHTAAPPIAGPSLEQLAVDEVDVSVFTPSSVAPAQRFLVQAVAYPRGHDADAARVAHLADPGATSRGVRGVAVPIALGTPLKIALRMPEFGIEEVQELRWAGRAEGVQFEVVVPVAFAGPNVIGEVSIWAAGLPTGRMRWQLDIGDGRSGEPEEHQVAPYSQAFISYASDDRVSVLERIQLLRVFKVNYFMDVLALAPGDRWEEELYRHIARCDLFLLFWSEHARQSEWVRREVDAAMRAMSGSDDARGLDLYPVPIEGPPVPEPWPDVKHLHFNDPLLYFMR